MTPTTSIKSPFEKGFASKMIIPSKKLASESLIASAKAAEAAVKIARIELAYTTYDIHLSK